MIRTIFREAKQPQPVEKIDNKTGLIKWGEDNLYGQFLVGLYQDNPVHGGIVNQKIKFITAGGIEVNTEIQMKNGRSPYTLQEVIDIICRDNEIADAYAILWRKDLVTGIWAAFPIDFELVRQTEDEVYFEVSDDWSKTKQDPLKTGWRKYKNILRMNSEDTEVLMYNITRPKQRKISGKRELTSNYYAIPNYSGAITSIMAGIEMDYFTFSEVVNGWKGGTVIALNNGVPKTEEEEDKIIRRIKSDSTDRDKQGGLTILFSEGKDQAPEISQMSGNDLDKRYIESNKEILRKIMIAHQVISPALFGVMSETLFGSKEEMTIAYKLFQENYAKYRQDKISDEINWAWKRLNKEDLGLRFNDYILNLEQNIEETNRTSAALNGMSPLVANKVLENLTINEIRGLAQLSALPNGDNIASQIPSATKPAAFNEEDPVLMEFEKRGSSIDEYIILESREYAGEDNEDEFIKSFFNDRFAMTIIDDDRNILQMINNGESYDAISKAIGKGSVYLSKRLFLLKDNGYLDGWKLTDKGLKESVVISEIEVLYSYEKKPGISGNTLISTSRPFCRALVQSNKLYSRDEITQISTTVERDVWNYRGGWYHNPDTDRTTPSCRHIWKQNIVTRRK